MAQTQRDQEKKFEPSELEHFWKYFHISTGSMVFIIAVITRK